MTSNLTFRLFNELIRKGYKVEDASDNDGDALLVQVYLNNTNVPFVITLVLLRDDNPNIGTAAVLNLKCVSSENRAKALEYINLINQTGLLTFGIDNQNQVGIRRVLFSSTNNLYDQYMSFIEMFPALFNNNIQDINRLLSL